METFEIYIHGRVLVGWVRAKTHSEAAVGFFDSHPDVKLIDIGRKGTATEWRFFCDGSSPVRTKHR